jgi:hypothetical protein
MRKIALLSMLLASSALPAFAQAGCPGQVSTVYVVIGQTVHVTYTRTDTCVGVPPSTPVTFSPAPTHVTIVADLTGFNITGTAVGTDGITWSAANFAPAPYNVVVSAIPTALTSP